MDQNLVVEVKLEVEVPKAEVQEVQKVEVREVQEVQKVEVREVQEPEIRKDTDRQVEVLLVEALHKRRIHKNI